MNRRLNVWHMGWVLMAMLVLATVILTGEASERNVAPDPTSYSIGGAAAFAELLRESGYRVAIDRSTSPDLQKGDLAIAYSIKPDDNPFATLSDPTQTTDAITKEAVSTWVEGGGAALYLPVDKTVDDPADVQVTSFTGSGKTPRTLSLLHPNATMSDDSGDESFPIGKLENQGTVAILAQTGQGYEMHVLDGYLALNDGIGRADNAEALMRLVRMLAPQGSRVVFATGTYGSAKPPSITEAIGPWAALAWHQCVLLMVVVIVSLGVRFGLPIETRRKEMGARQLIDALGGLYERTRATDRALSASLRRAEAMIRKKLKLGADANLSAYYESLPSDLTARLLQIKAMIGTEPTAEFTVQAVRKLDQAVSDFARTKRSAR